MKLSKEQRAYFWRELSKLKKQTNELKFIFQNEVDICQDEYAL